MRLNLSKLFILIIFCLLSNSLTELEANYYYLEINRENNPNILKQIGTLGTIGLVTDDSNTSFFNSSDLEAETHFPGTFIERSYYNFYDFDCRLWNPKNSNIIVLCSMMDNYNLSNTSNFEFLAHSFVYKDYRIEIRTQEELFFQFQQFNEEIPFLYSEPQDVYLNNPNDYYDLNFKYESTYPLHAFLREKEEANTFTLLNNCSRKNGNLVFHIKKESLEELFTYNSSLTVSYLTKQYGPFKYEFVLDINNLYDQTKEDINIVLTEVLNTISEVNSLIAIRTNITQIGPLTSKMFLLKFYDRSQSYTKKCFFKKYDNNETSMFLFCKMDEKGKFDFFIEEEKIILNDIHYKYNFAIYRTEIYERINVDGNGKNIIYYTTEVLDFTTSSSDIIEYFSNGAQFFEDIKLNPDSPSLICDINTNYYKRCTVDKTHFEGKETGYYYHYYKNHLNKSEIAYDARPVKVIVEPTILIRVKYEDNKDIIKVGEYINQGGKYSFGTLPLKTDFDDTETNIFNISNIESNIYVIGKSRHSTRCRLWKPKKGKIKLFIRIGDGTLNSNENNVTFERVTFTYKEKTIIIKTDDYFQIKYLTYQHISFLYSDPQTIDLDQDVESYILKFKFDLYNKDPFYLFSGTSYIPVDNCNPEGKELLCNIKKETIEENLIKKGNFKMAALNDYEGSLSFNFVDDIIITYNDTREKGNVKVIVNYPYESFSRKGQAFAYKTNIYSTSNFISDKFNMTFIDDNYDESYQICYLKKSEDQNKWSNVILLCTINSDGNYLLKEQTIILNDIHYKYNFTIKKLEDNNWIFLYGQGTHILFSYPHTKNLTLEEIGTFKYIMDSPDTSGNIYVSQNINITEFFNCTNIDFVKICKINMTYFVDKPNGFYYNYYYDSAASPSSGFFYDSPPCNLILPKSNLIVLRIKESVSTYRTMGSNGIIYFLTDYYDNKNIFNVSNLEDIAIFNSTVLEGSYDYIYNVTCRLWKPSQDRMRVFCDLLKGFTPTPIHLYYYLKLNEALFNFNDYQVSILANNFITIRYYNTYYPFLYSDKQTIEIEDEKDTYELKFKILSYNNDLLYLYYKKLLYNNYLILDNCNINGKELICQIQKKDLQQYMSDYTIVSRDNYDNYLRAYNDEQYYYIGSVLAINFKSNEYIDKEYIYVQITKLLVKDAGYPSSIVFETNINSISELKTVIFDNKIYFTNNSSRYDFYCYFQKTQLNNLLLFCTYGLVGNYQLIPITSRIYLYDIHYKYNFIIQPYENNEIIHIYKSDIKITEVYPKLIDLSLDDSKDLYYFITVKFYSSINTKFRLNINSSDLFCIKSEELYDDLTAKCIVPLNHFEGKKTGYYYTYYENYNNEWVINYEVPPIYVILPEENVIVLRIKEENNKKVKKIGRQRFISFTTDYNDNINNIFDDNDIKNKTTFNTLLLDDKGYSYDALCSLWKPLNEKMRIFCEIKTLLRNYEQNVTLQTVNFTYNNYTIVIYSKDSIKVNQYTYSLSFFYAKEQTINIEEGKDSYELKFNYYVFNYPDKFYLYGETNDSAVFDKCQTYDPYFIINCNISKEKIEEILTVNNGQFKLGLINEDFGSYIFEDVMNITINYTLERKEMIYATIGKLKSQYTEVGVAVAYEMTVSNNILISNMNTFTFDYFKNFGFCRFKKTNLNGLLLLCTPLKTGRTYLGFVNGKTFDNIHYKYDFYISYSYNYDYVYIEDHGSEIYLMEPKELNFTFVESLEVEYIMDKPELVNNIKINPDSDELNCTNYVHNKKCIVPFDHFKGKKNGFYYIYHSNHLNESSIYYSSSPHKIILNTDGIIVIRITKEDNKNEILLGEKGTLEFITNYIDELNIFDISDIEEKTSFETNITDEYKNKYNIKCRLWKPLGEKLRLFCNMPQIIKNSTIEVTLTEVNFPYNNQTVYIISKERIIIRQLPVKIPFLYSQKQSIIIQENILNYKFEFNVDNYYNNLLYLYLDNSYIILDKCEKNSKILTCIIDKNKLEENLILDFDTNKNNFALSAFIDDYSLGSITFNSVFDINIQYNDITKKDVYLQVGKLLNKVSESDAVVAYRTNVTSIQNMKTNRFILPFYDLLNDEISEGNCYFKKSDEDSLLLLCDIIGNGYFYILEIDEVITIRNISYRYNFIIEPMDIDIYDVIRIDEYGSEVLLTYPQTLNFTLEDSFTIKYIMTSNYYSNKIKLNPDSDYLDCIYTNGIQTCQVHMSHFTGKANGYYYTHHLNHLNDLSIYYDSAPFNVVIRPDNTILIRIKQEDNGSHIQIGKKGTLAFVTDYNDDELNIFNISDIEEKTSFETNLTDNFGNIYETKCHLWKPMKEKLVLLCKANEDLKHSFQYVTLDLFKFNYNNYTIIIKFEEAIYTRQLNYEIPFIYSDVQEIFIKEGIDYYEFKFNSEAYNNELLYIYNSNNYIQFDYCNKEGKSLTCNIKSDKLEENLGMTGLNKPFKLRSLTENLENMKFNLVKDIYFTGDIKEKRNIYIHIGKLMKNLIHTDELFSYETEYNGVIPNLITNKFNMEFQSITYNKTYEGECYFKKVQGSDLILICHFWDYGFSRLKQINNEILLNDINYKYNFIIIPVNNNDEFFITYDWDSQVLMTYPQILNFTLEDSLTIKYIMMYPMDSKNIRLNNESDYLNCSYSSNIKTCLVPMSHFKGKENGFYNTYHSFEYNNTLITNIYYESNPFNVILRPKNEIVLRIKLEDNKEGIKIGNQGILYFLTDYNDNELNIFNKSDIEINFLTKIRDKENNEYNTKCNLWKQKNENINIFCYMNETFKNKNQSIILDIITIHYNEYTLIIYPKDYIHVEKYDFNFPFLYSNEQFIEIKNDIDLYEIKFNIGIYENDLLYLKGTQYNYGIIDKCEIKEKELICQLSKENLEEILTINNESFSLEAMNDNIGVIKFNFVSDIFIYENITKEEKEDIYVGIINITNDYSEIATAFGLITNVTSIPNINSGILNTLYFKKTKGNPLLLLYITDFEDDYEFTKLEKEFICDDIHFKYNFRIQPFNLNKIVHVYNEGTEIMLTYPEILDFTKNEEITIRYLMPNPLIGKNIKLKQDSPDLECEDLIGMKKCIVNKTHFGFEESGFFNTYHLNHIGELSIYYNSAPFDVILPNKILRIKKENNKDYIYTGINGTLYIVTDYNDTELNIFNISDIEEKTSFETIFTDDYENIYDTKCRLWKPLNENIRILCNFNGQFSYNRQFITLNSTSFIYGSYNIIIISEENSLMVYQYNDYIPFLYNDNQTIIIEDGKQYYDLHFKYDSYNGEKLYLKSLIRGELLDNCKIVVNEVICSITKEKIETFLEYDKQKFELWAIVETLGAIYLNSVFDIIINYPSEKEDIYVSINKLLDNTTEMVGTSAYETNISDIDIINTGLFELNFNNSELLFYFKKTINNNMLLICIPTKEGEFNLGKIEQVVLDNIHYKYNFIIQQAENYENISVANIGTYIELVYPEILNFTLEESINIYYMMPLPSYANYITLNTDSYYLDCENLLNMKKCKVDKSHFEGKESGYYNTYHLNHLNKYSIYYDANPFNIILPEKEKSIDIMIEDFYIYEHIEIGINGTLYIRTSYNDNELNIFNISDIENKTSSDTILYDEDGNKYNIKCRLWKPLNDYIKIFCDLNGQLNKEEQKVYFDPYSFYYNDYKVNIIFNIQYLTVNQYDFIMPFLYSDKQIINVEEDKDSYELKFKIGKYNNEKLIFYGRALNALILEGCEIEGKDLICKIYKNQLDEILTKYGERFYLSYSNEIKFFDFNNVMNIIINYNYTNKENIYIGITKLIGEHYDIFNFIAYETNITNISNVVTDIFELKINTSEISCFFKKTEESKLLFLCLAAEEGNYSLGEITEEIIKEDINIKYNFHIQPVINNEIYSISGQGSYILTAYPMIFNFTSIDSLTIEFVLSFSEYMKIKLNPDANELECINGENTKRCIVPKSHFENKTSGYYYVYHLNHLNEYIISYEMSPVRVILPNDDENSN